MMTANRLFRINLSTTAGSHVTPMRAGLMASAVLLLGAGTLDYRQVDSLREQAAELEQALARVRDIDRRVQLPQRAGGTHETMKTSPRDVAVISQLIARSAFSWTQFLGDLEGVVPAGVSIQNLRLDTKNSTIVISATALNMKELTHFIVKLSEHQAFQEAALQQHRSRDNEVEFAMTVKYNPAED
ncbi:PilN domain-containing protein [Nitrospira sp. Nam80]